MTVCNVVSSLSVIVVDRTKQNETEQVGKKMKIWVDDGVVQLVFGIDNEDARTVQCGCSNRNRIVRNEQNRLAFRETREGCQVDGLMVGVILLSLSKPKGSYFCPWWRTNLFVFVDLPLE